MKKKYYYCLLLCFFVFFIISSCNKNVPDLLKGVQNIDQAALRFTINDGRIIYFDPVNVEKTNDADIIFITHTHQDHFSFKGIMNVKKENTKIILTGDGINKIKKRFDPSNIIIVEPEKSYEVDGIKFETVPAYNIIEDRKWHPKIMNWVGYIVTINNISYYISGDTDIIPEIKKIQADVVFLAVSGSKSQLYGDEGAKLAKIIKPKIAVAYHPLYSPEELDKFMDNIENDIIAVYYKDGEIFKIKNY